jgi:hypothetical protein
LSQQAGRLSDLTQSIKTEAGGKTGQHERRWETMKASQTSYSHREQNGILLKVQAQFPNAWVNVIGRFDGVEIVDRKSRKVIATYTIDEVLPEQSGVNRPFTVANLRNK